MEELAHHTSAADEILQIACDHDIPLRPDPQLVAALASLDIGRQIPPELFCAVAEVLSFVYKVNRKA